MFAIMRYCWVWEYRSLQRGFSYIEVRLGFTVVAFPANQKSLLEFLLSWTSELYNRTK